MIPLSDETICKQTGIQLPNEAEIFLGDLVYYVSLKELRGAVNNFLKDDWPDRHKYIDIVYCIGIRNKIDNLEKWMNFVPPEKEEELA